MEIISHVLQYDVPENSSYPHQSHAYPKPTAVPSKESASTDNTLGERIPTRCNNIDIYCQFKYLILTTVPTCFGHLYAHHQEKKTTCYCIWGCLLEVLDVAGCGTVVLRCRV